MPTRILITGAGGFVGRRLTESLHARFGSGAVLCAADRRKFTAGCAVSSVDLLDADRVCQVVDEFKPDVVLHMAAQSSIGQSSNVANETWRTNLVGSLNLAEACARIVPECSFFFASSGEVYGASLKSGHVDEATPLQPLNAYARSKAAAEGMLTDVLGGRGRLVIIRAFNHSGAGQDERFVLPSFARQIAQIEAGRRPPFIEVGNLAVERDFLHVSDVVDAYVRLVAGVGGLPARSVFNLCSGTAISLRDVLGIMSKMTPVHFDVRVAPGLVRKSDVSRVTASFAALAAVAGWRPRISLTDLLAEVLDHARLLEKECR